MATKGMAPVEIRKGIESSFGRRLELATVRSWVTGSHSPYGRVYRLPSEPSPELAYLIGANFGDTSRSRNWRHNYTIRLRVRDEDFAREIARAASAILGKPYKVWFDNRRGLWQIDVLSMLLFKLLTRPLADLKPIITHCKACIAAFIRGFFDADGSSAGGLTASNGNLELLKYIRYLLADCFGVETTGPRKKGPPPGTAVMIKGKGQS